MNYNKSQREAMEAIRNHPEVEIDLLEEIETYIIEPNDVLYYLRAFGDLELAVTIHPLPKHLPDNVLMSMGQYDVLGDWQGNVTEHECPICESELYEFDWQYDYLILNEFGDSEGEEIWYLSDPAGFYWDTTGEHRMMCGHCANDRRSFSREMDSHYGVKVYYGDRDKWFPFSYQNGVVRWDGEWYMDNKNVQDINLHSSDGEDRVGLDEIATAFAGSSEDKQDLFTLLGWTSMEPTDLDVSVSGVRRAKRYAKEVLEGWAEVTDSTEQNPTHPDFDFPYIIEDGSTIYFPSGEWETVKYYWEDQVLFEANEMEALQNHRDEAGA